MSYLQKDFLLTNESAKKLYFNYAEKQPIFDYHCHLSEKAILEDEPFNNIYEIWLSGDHYKWRLMRNAGVDEEYITGSMSEKDKFLKYCEVLETSFGNPLYHWSQLELKIFFDCELEINSKNGSKIWDECNAYIIKNKLSPVKLINSCNVKTIFTTNEIDDDLSTFSKIREKKYSFDVAPAFRADKLLNIESNKFMDVINKFGDIKNLDDLETLIESQLKKFMSLGCVASDIALEKIELIAPREMANKVLIKRIKNKSLSPDEVVSFKGYLTYFLLILYGKYNIRSQLHIGAKRNNNSMMFKKIGADTGYDSVSDYDSTSNLSLLLNRLNSEFKLPPLILYNLNQKMNGEILSLIGCFQDSSIKGKIQYGPAWWFLDNKNDIEKHLKDLSTYSHIASFVGMTTDSRSFLSYARHYYFRRILCNYFGELIEAGEMTDELDIVGKVVEDISYNNANVFFRI